MAASRLNYLILYKGESQVYGSGSKSVALETAPPPGLALEDKHIYFITHHPDTGEVIVHEIPREEVLSAEVKAKQTKKSVEKEENIVED